MEAITDADNKAANTLFFMLSPFCALTGATHVLSDPALGIHAPDAPDASAATMGFGPV